MNKEKNDEKTEFSTFSVSILMEMTIFVLIWIWRIIDGSRFSWFEIEMNSV